MIPVFFCSSLRFLRSACRCGWGQSDWHAALFRGSTCSAACIIIDRTREEKWDHGKGPGILERYNWNHWRGSSYSISLPKLIQCVSRVFRALQEQGFAWGWIRLQFLFRFPPWEIYHTEATTDIGIRCKTPMNLRNWFAEATNSPSTRIRPGESWQHRDAEGCRGQFYVVLDSFRMQLTDLFPKFQHALPFAHDADTHCLKKGQLGRIPASCWCKMTSWTIHRTFNFCPPLFVAEITLRALNLTSYLKFLPRPFFVDSSVFWNFHEGWNAILA